MIKLEYPLPWIKKPNCDSNLYELSIIKFCSRASFPIVEKCIRINKPNQIYFWIFGQEINSNELNIIPATNIDKFLENVKQFENVLVCHGGPNAPKTLCSVKCSTDFLKHNDCCLIIKNKAKSCDKCKTLNNVLILKEKRKMAGCTVNLILSPTKKQKVNALRKKTYNLLRSLINNNKNNKGSERRTNCSSKSMAECPDNMIQDKISGMNDSQKCLIKEYFAASKIKNSKNRRFSENWLMLCLLFNIRSPSAYKYLRKSALMPLPHPKVLGKHLSPIKRSCGFDEDFIRLLEKKRNRCLK